MPSGGERALEVHLDDRIPLRLAHVREHAVAEDASVVDEDVEATERIDGGLDEAFGSVPIADVVAVGDRLPTHGLDLGDDIVRGALIVALAVHRPAEVVDHDLGAVVGEEQCVLAPDASARPRDDRDAALAELGHAW